MFSFIKSESIPSAEFFGDFAIITGIISFFPIIINMWYTKNTSNFTWINLMLALISNIMWISYGVLSNSNTNIASGTLYFFIYLYIFLIKFKFT